MAESNSADPEDAPEREPAHPSTRPRRWRRARLAPPTQGELDAIPADRRLELLDLAHQRRHRWFSTWILMAGVLATVGTLLVTALTLRGGQQQLDLARQGQITDRYNKATEQLGSSRREVRAAAIYALERISKESDQDSLAIRDVLATFIREHDPAPGSKSPAVPDADVAAALTVLARNPVSLSLTPGATRLDLRGARLHGANLMYGFLIEADLTGADLSGANLFGIRLNHVTMKHANLSGADMRKAIIYIDVPMEHVNLSGADLTGVDVPGGVLQLKGSNVSGADLNSRYIHRRDLLGTQGVPKRVGGG